jgi:hypothetical protein
VVAVASLAGAALVMSAIPSLASAGSIHPKLMSSAQVRKIARHSSNLGELSPAARQAKRQGYLVPNPAQYKRQKARATRRAEARQALSAPATTGPLAPSIISGKSWQGINENTHTPPDETSAVGTQKYIELVNAKFAIYNKTSNTPAATGSLNALVGRPSTDHVFDPQIIWDPTTNRFYYAADDVIDPSNNLIAFGFSKTASPAGASSFCHYFLNFGTVFADYPKLGDSRFFQLIGSNVFNSSGSFLGADLAAISKPPAGTSCPAIGNFHIDDNGPLKMTATNPAFTPVPANEIDTNGTGWVVARSGSLPATKLGLFKVTKNASGDPVIPVNAASLLTVPSYTAPPDAPQQGSVNPIDTNDSRNTQAVAANDPAHSGKLALWTQHTTQGGAGAQVRWYEINPVGNSLFQSGKATSGSLFEFNGAISPNRQVNGGTTGGGNSMVMNFNTSSSATKPAIKMVSKIGANGQSGQVAVKSSPGQLSGFDCSKVATTGHCRWGDYAAATPDPSTANRIWNVSQFAVGSGSGTSGFATSRTWNFVAKP